VVLLDVLGTVRTGAAPRAVRGCARALGTPCEAARARSARADMSDDGGESDLSDDYYFCHDHCDSWRWEQERRADRVAAAAEASGFEVLEVRGSHRKPCSHCSLRDWQDELYYVVDASNPWGTDKYCLDCAEMVFAVYSGDDDDYYDEYNEDDLAEQEEVGEGRDADSDGDVEIVQVKDVNTVEADKLAEAKRTGRLIDLVDNDSSPSASARKRTDSDGKQRKHTRGGDDTSNTNSPSTAQPAAQPPYRTRSVNAAEQRRAE